MLSKSTKLEELYCLSYDYRKLKRRPDFCLKSHSFAFRVPLALLDLQDSQVAPGPR